MSTALAVTVLICSLVFIGTIVGLWGGLSRTVRVLHALRPGLELARSLSSHPVPEAAFAHRWADLDAAFRGSEIVAPAWTPFAASVERSTRPDGSGALASSTAPEDWLHARNLAAGGWSDPAVGRLAGLLVSLGILGTFLGLTLGLVEADFGAIQALSSADARTEALQAAMFGLLAGSSTAFLTSVAGLAGSLTLSAVVRLGATRRIDRALAQAAACLRAGVRVEPPELRLALQLRSLAEPSRSEGELLAAVEQLTRAVEGLRPPAMPREVVAVEPEDDALGAVLDRLEQRLGSLETVLQAPAAPPEAPSPPPETAPAWAEALAERALAPPVPAPLDPELVAALDGQRAVLRAVTGALATQDRRLVALEARLGAVVEALSDATAAGADPVLIDVLGRLDAHLVAEAERAAAAQPVAPPGPAATPEPPPPAVPVADHLEAALGPTLARLEATAGTFSAAAGRFDTATARLDGAARANHEAAQTLRDASDHLGTRLAVLQQSTAAIRTGLAHHTDASNALTAAAASLQGVGPQLTRATDQVRLSASAMDTTAQRLSALQQASGGPEIARLVPVLESLLAALEQRR